MAGSENDSTSVFLLGLDLGISTAKAGLFDLQGNLVQIQSEEYLILPEGDKVETHPETYWQPLVRLIRRLLKLWGGDARNIAGVSVSSHTESVISVKQNGEPSRKAIVWMDNRSSDEARELLEQVGVTRVMEIAGQPEITSIWPVTKLRWLAKHEPKTTRETAKFLLPEDYILFRLCGKMVAEQTVWSSSVLLDIRKKAWSSELLAFGAIRESQLPEIVAPSQLLGPITEECARETGLNPRTQVVAGAIDQVCAAIGAGNIAPGIVTESTGSVLALLATVDQPISDPSFGIPCHIHAISNTYCLLPWHPSGGLILKWFKDTLATCGEEGALKASDYESLSAEADSVPAGSDGLIMLPHFQGALFPECSPAARGVFFGLTLSQKRGHLVRAILEAVGYMIRRDLEGLRRMGVDPKEIRVLGGGARSRSWSQIKADICKVRILTMGQPEAAALGAAILAAVGTGYYPNIADAVREMTKTQDVISPDRSKELLYDSAYTLYVDLYDAVKDLFARSAKIKDMAMKPIDTLHG